MTTTSVSSAPIARLLAAWKDELLTPNGGASVPAVGAEGNDHQWAPTQRFFNTLPHPYSDTWSQGALKRLVGPVPPLKILGKSWPMLRRIEQASRFHRRSVA